MLLTHRKYNWSVLDTSSSIATMKKHYLLYNVLCHFVPTREHQGGYDFTFIFFPFQYDLAFLRHCSTKKAISDQYDLDKRNMLRNFKLTPILTTINFHHSHQSSQCSLSLLVPFKISVRWWATEQDQLHKISSSRICEVAHTELSTHIKNTQGSAKDSTLGSPVQTNNQISHVCTSILAAIDQHWHSISLHFVHMELQLSLALLQ